MSQLSEQFSAVRQAQINAQLKIFSHFSARAVENAEKLVALNLHTSRAALDHSAAAFKQLIGAHDPRDLLSLATEGQHQFDSMLAYGRALIGIAAGAPAAVAAADAPAPAAAAAPAPAVEALPAPARKAAKTKPRATAAAPFPTVQGAQLDMPAPKAAKKK